MKSKIYKIAHRILPNSIKDLIVSGKNKKNKLKTLSAWKKIESLNFRKIDFIDSLNIDSSFETFNILGMSFSANEIVKTLKTDISEFDDIKEFWEVARMQYLPHLALNSKIKEIEKVLNSWQNIPSYKKWGNAMETAIRAINISIAFQKLSSQKIEFEFEKELLKHGTYIWNNLEKMPKNSNNHYLTNLLGLFWLGLNFKDSEIGQKWFKFAHREFEKEIKNQIYQDGFSYEGSTGYQALIVEILFLAKLLADENETPFSHEYTTQLSKEMRCLQLFSFSDGTHANIGDNDSGKIINYNWELTKNNITPLLQLSDHLEQKCSVNQVEILNQINAIVVTQKAHKLIFWSGIVDEEPLFAEHKHNDIFNTILELDSNPIFIDSGSYRYNRSLDERKYFVREEAHNTINFFKPQRIMNGFFHKKNRDIVLNSFNSKDNQITAETTLQNINWKRNVIFNNFEKITIKDTVSKCGKINFVLSPKLTVDKINDNTIRFSVDNSIYEFMANNKITVREHFVSFEYGIKTKTSRLEILIEKEMVCSIQKI